MSRENVEIVRALFDPFDGVDVTEIDWGSEAIREILERTHAPDVELRTLESAIGTGPSRFYSGWDGLVRYLREWFEPFSDYRMDLLDYIDAGNRVIVPIKARGVGSGSGIRVDMALTLAYELRGGLITRIDQYDTVEDALEAAGLSE
jgi:ketosteroid isomerase-like protein